ncbi:MAG: type II secretion system protein [Elusimicrobiota bacterium]
MTGRRRRGFTLIELLVCVLIVGILCAMSIPSYLKSLETSKADDAVALVNMIATTNRMFFLDHSGNYAVGAFPATAGISCGSIAPGTCPASNSGGPACALVWCKYLADQDFGSSAYDLFACNGGPCFTSGGSGIAGARRKSGTYSTWGYAVSAGGVITANGGAPAPTY